MLLSFTLLEEEGGQAVYPPSQNLAPHTRLAEKPKKGERNAEYNMKRQEGTKKWETRPKMKIFCHYEQEMDLGVS